VIGEVKMKGKAVKKWCKSAKEIRKRWDRAMM
jgi:hypothetical protein